MNDDGIMECIDLLTSELPLLRDSLGITQKNLAKHIGISRQSVIEIEHKNHKLTRSILIALITFFSFREETAKMLYSKGFYNNKFVNLIGFNSYFLFKIYGIKDGANT